MKWGTVLLDMTHQTPRKPVLLVVDDQPSNIQVLHQIFKTDHEVFMATSGEQALTFCATQLPDLILLDVIMPGLNGHQVCVKLKSDPRTQDIPVIFVTGHSNPEDESEGLRLGAVDFISKPVNAATVRARVNCVRRCWSCASRRTTWPTVRPVPP